MTGGGDVLRQARSWHRDGRRVALATVVSTWGSSPRPVGSQLAVDGDGNMAGSVSGGCVEGAVVTEAAGAMRDGRPRLLDFGVSDEQAWEAGLACGGRVEVYVAGLDREAGGAATLDAVLEAAAARTPLALVTAMDSGDQALVFADRAEGSLALAAAETDAARRALDDDQPGRIGDDPARPLFVQVFNPPRRLALVGAVHIAQRLAPMAALTGYAVTVIDPRRSFATADRFPGVELRDDWPDDALAALAPDRRTAIVTLTHDPKLDDPALACGLASPAFFIGALGSRRTHAGRLERLRARGFDDAALARIHGPVGLAIGAASPAEIAVAILAQMTAVLHGSPAHGAAA